MKEIDTERNKLNSLVGQFQQTAIPYQKTTSDTAIQAVIIPGNENVKEMASKVQSAGFDVRPILYPTVPRNLERLRIVLHSFNTPEELNGLTQLLSN